MKRITGLIVALIAMGCGDSTGPSHVLRDQLLVIDAATGNVLETSEVLFRGDCHIAVSSSEDFLYITHKNYISKFDLASMTVVSEQYIPGSSTCLVSPVLSENDSLLFVSNVTSSGAIYKLETSSMAVVDSADVDQCCPFMALRPGTDMLYIFSYTSNQILKLDISTMAFLDTLDISTNGEFRFSDSGDEIYATHMRSLLAYDPDTGDELRSKTFPEAHSVSSELSLGSSSIYLTYIDPYEIITLVEVDRNSFAVTEILQDCKGGYICYAGAVARLFLYPNENSNIAVYDMPGFQPAGEVDVDDYLYEIVLSPGSDKLYCYVYYNSNPDID